MIAAATIAVQEGMFVFEEIPTNGPAPTLDDSTLAVVRDDHVWSRLVRVSQADERTAFGLIRFHFAEGQDNSGFLGWLATHLKRKLGIGTFVVCGQNSECGGIFDYSGFPYELRDAVLEEIARLRGSGEDMARVDGPPRSHD